MTLHRDLVYHARRAVLGAVVCSALTSAALADTLHNIGQGDFQHHESGWIFPERIGEFIRIGAPQDVDGTVDVVAHYTRVHDGARTSAIVDVYPATSSAATARDADASDEMSSERASSERSNISIEGPIPITVVRTQSSNADALYFVDTGTWIVKIRVRSETVNDPNSQAIDAFVHRQRWDSLNLTPTTCTGPACGSAAR